MSLGTLKEFVNAHCPAPLLPVLKIPYRLVTAPYRFVNKTLRRERIIARAKKYLPYYQDELSREILAARFVFIRTGDQNVFLDIAEKTGMAFSGGLPEGNYSRIAVVHDGNTSNIRYTSRRLDMTGWKGKYRFITLQDFLNGSAIHSDELINAILSPKNMALFDEHVSPGQQVKRRLIGSSRADLQSLDVFDPADDEVVIDAGCFNGTTAMRFLEWGHEKVKRVYSFEFAPAHSHR